jgi:hypothetical protein
VKKIQKQKMLIMGPSQNILGLLNPYKEDAQ